MNTKKNFDRELITTYPHSNIKLGIFVKPYGFAYEDIINDEVNINAETIYLSPFGIEFFSDRVFEKDQLVKISIKIPYFWEIKKKFVNYSRVNTPEILQTIGKVISCRKNIRRNRNIITSEILNMDKIDEKVLKYFLENK